MAISANAGEKTWDFETDPFEEFPFITSNQEDLVWGGQGWDDWVAEGNPGGFFSISEAGEGLSTIAVLPDIDNGEFVKAFTMTMDLRMGNGTTDRPADGISINFARAAGPGVTGDPMLADLEGGSANPSNAATSGAAETGTRTGVAISFDTWAGNALPDGPDIEGVIVRVDNKTVGRFAMPVRHGAPEDIESLQTGPQGGSPAAPDAERGDPSILSWQPLEVSVNELGLLNVNYKNQPLVQDFESGFFPSPGQIILMGRTGGANEVHHVDNLKLVTELANEPIITGLEATADSFSVTFRDIGLARVLQETITVSLDGEDVTGALNVTKDGEFTTVEYQSPVLFASGSTHVVDVKADTSNGGVLSANPSFTAATYATVPPGLALSNVDTSTPGFLMYVKQSAAGLANSTDVRLAHLADDSENIADDWGSEDYVWTLDIINFDQDGNPQGEFRDLQDGSSMDVMDDFIPGIPGLEGGTDNITAMIDTVVRIPEAGFYTFGFNSDDGFLTTIGNDQADAVKLGEFNGGRGASTTPYKVYFEAAGDYPMQSLWYEGGGGANLEWFTIEPNKALLNDTDNGGLRTFAVKPTLATTVTAVSPAGGSNPFPSDDISVTIQDGSASVDAGSVSLTVNGQAVDASVNKSGGVTAVDLDRGGAMWGSGEEVTVGLSYTAGGATREVSWSFNARTYVGIAMDSVSGHSGLVLGDASWSADGGGASGQPGDLALDLTGTAGTMVVKGADFLNDAFAKDVLTVAFWAKKDTIQNSSSIWITSESAGSGNRGFQAHTPWSNNNVYFDTQGCCNAGTQRVNGDVATYENYEDTFWDGWHLWSFTKDMDLKEVRIDGTLFLESTGADPLSADVMDFWLGSERGEGNYDRSLFDDVAIFDHALSESDLKSVVSGASLGSLDGLIAFWDFNTAPAAGLADGSVIAINFAADEPAGNRSDVTGAAGVLGTVNWNNVDSAAGSASDLAADVAGSSAPSGVSVEWASPNTWSSTGRGEENNTGSGNDGNLMTGYIDTNAEDPISATVSGLPDGATYDVIVYIKGGVNGKGGDYTIGDQVLSHTDTAAFDGTFVYGEFGDYLVFKGVTGSSFTLQSQPTHGGGSAPRAPINGLEVVIGGGVEVPGGGGDGSISSVALADGSVVIEYTGTLKSATSVTGPYSPVAGASSPYSVAPTQAAEFYIAE